MKKDIDSIYDGFVIKTTGEVIGNLEVDKKSFTAAIGKTNGEHYYKVYEDPKTIRYHNFSRELNNIIRSMDNDVINYLDLRAISFPLSFKDTLVIDKNLILLLPNSDITFNNEDVDQNMIEITSNYCNIVGNSTNKLIFSEENDSLKGYHIASYIDNTVIISNIILEGKQSELGRQYESVHYPINGSGGIYKEKGKLIVTNSTIDGTKISGIYLQDGTLTSKNNTIKNTGGDGIFCNNCKNILLNTNILDRCNMSGIHIYNSINIVNENNTITNSGVGEFIRSSNIIFTRNNILDYMYNKGSNPWEDSSEDTNNVGFNITDSNGNTILDVTDDTKDKYRGNGQLFIDSEILSNTTNSISNIGLAEDHGTSKYSLFISYTNIENGTLHKPNISMTEEDHDRKNDIAIDSDSKTIEVMWSPKNYGIVTKTTDDGFTTDSTITDPLYFGCTESYLMTETDSYLDGERIIVNHQPVTFDRENGRIGINNDSPDYNIDNIGTLHSTKLVQFDDTLTVDKDVLFKSNLEVDLDTLIKGSVTINTDLHTLGDSNLDGDVIIGKTLDVKDDTTLESNLDVKLDSTLEGTLTVTKATVLKDTLEVDSDTSLKAKLDVTGSTTLNDTLDVTGATKLNDILEVVKSVTLDDTLTVTSSTILKDTLEVDSDTTLKAKLSVTGSTSLDDTLDVTSSTTLNDTLKVVGDTTLDAKLSVSSSTTLSDTLDVTSTTKLNDTLEVVKATTLDDDLKVKGNTTLDAYLEVSNNSVFHSNVTIDNDLTVSNNSLIEGTISGKLNLDISNKSDTDSKPTFNLYNDDGTTKTGFSVYVDGDNNDILHTVDLSNTEIQSLTKDQATFPNTVKAGGDVIVNKDYTALYNFKSDLDTIGGQYYGNGLINKWGNSDTDTSTTNIVTGNISFENSFENNCFQVIATPIDAPNDSWDAVTVRITNITKDGFDYLLDTTDTDQHVDNNVQLRYFAIGN